MNFSRRGLATGRALVIVIDGYGFDPLREALVLEEVARGLPGRALDLVKLRADELTAQWGLQEPGMTMDDVLRDVVSPTPVTRPHAPWATPWFRRWLADVRESVDAILMAGSGTHARVDSVIREEARRKNYAIWTANTPYLFSLRRTFPTLVTKTSGVEVGYEDLRPEVQGNSETGHQQLGNLVVAVQPPLEIGLSIENGSFFDNPVLNESVETAINKRVNLDLCFLLSGQRGDDGRVHSCWNHLEAFLELCFLRHRLPPTALRVQAILDGRDAPLYSSVSEKDGVGGFLHKLLVLLSRYNATEALSWVIGRSIAMDRDYSEEKARQDYLLLTRAEGIRVSSFEEAVKAVEEQHKAGATDAYVKPIAVLDSQGRPRVLSRGDVFVDLNFRADRQRAKIASLLGATDFLSREALKSGNTWSMEWLDSEADWHVYCLTDYHPEFSRTYGAKVAFETLPHQHNFLNIVSRASRELGRPFRYLLLAESTKALHMGYFIRGRREQIDAPECEARTIVPSYGQEHGIAVDDDYYKTPQMKAFELAGVLANEAYTRSFDLIVVNFSNPDMVGHLICDHFDSVVESVEVVERALGAVVPLALKLGYHVVITSDHGNADEFSPSHGSHDVLTTFVSPFRAMSLRADLRRIRLFDIPWCLMDILGVRESVLPFIPEIPARVRSWGLVGSSALLMSDRGNSETQGANLEVNERHGV